MDFSATIDFFLGQAGKLVLSLGSHFSATSLAAALVIAALFFAWQRVKRGRRLRWRVIARALFPKRIVRHRSNRADIGYLLFNVFLSGIVFGWAVLTYQAITNTIITALVSIFGPVAPSTLPVIVSRAGVTVLLFLGYELGYWFNHWLSHKVPFLWEFHKVHHTAEVLTPITNFRVHPVYSWIFANILAFSAAVAGGIGNYAVRQHHLPIRHQRHQYDPGALHPHLRASAALAHVDLVHRRARPHLRVARASPSASLGQSEALQQEFRQLPGAVGLDVRHALRAGERARAAHLRLSRSRRCAHLQGRSDRSGHQRRRPSQAAAAETRAARPFRLRSASASRPRCAPASPPAPPDR